MKRFFQLPIATALCVAAATVLTPSSWAQDELWVLNETPPSLGRIDLTSFSYEELLSFDNVGYATDLRFKATWPWWFWRTAWSRWI